MYDYDNPEPGPIGFNGFRCTAWGVQCGDSPAPVPPIPGDYGECAPQQDSPYLYHPDHYASFLLSLKQHPSQIFVGAIVGTPAPVRVVESGSGPMLEHSCAGSDGQANAGIRFRGLVNAFPGGSFLTSICPDSLAADLDGLTSALKQALYQPRCF